ncbi:MAG: serpin family protein [Saprospiraceae bacterium]|nr:serpin family protein [Saprospiraceae bacterium]
MHTFFDKVFSILCSHRQNVSICPLSFKILFTLLLKGSRGEKQKQLIQLCGWKGSAQEENEILDVLYELEKEDKSVKFEMENCITHTQLLKVNRDYLEKLNAFLLPRVEIDDRVTDDPEVVCSLVNRLSLEVKWKDRFLDMEEKSNIFYLNEDECVEAYYMHRPNKVHHNSIQYHASQNFHAVSIPFKDENLSFEVVLPYEKDGIHELLAELPYEKLIGMNEHFSEINRIEVVLPKFDFNSEISIAELEKELNTENLFQPTWEFDPMLIAPAPLYLIDIKHQNSISIDLEGMRMTAKSEALFGIRGLPPNPEEFVYFNANRPFLYVIRERETNSILQYGTVFQPNIVNEADRFLEDKIETRKKSQLVQIQQFNAQLIHLSLRGVIYMGLICISEIAKKYGYTSNVLSRWMEGTIGLLENELPTSVEIRRLDIESDENITGYPYNSDYLPESEYKLLLKNYPNLMPTVFITCSAISELSRVVVGNHFFSSEAVENLCKEMVKHDINFPDYDILKVHLTKPKNEIGPIINIDYNLIAAL